MKLWKHITFSKVEGIIPAIESVHALSYVEKLAPNMDEKLLLWLFQVVEIKIWKQLNNTKRW